MDKGLGGLDGGPGSLDEGFGSLDGGLDGDMDKGFAAWPQPAHDVLERAGTLDREPGR